MGIFVLIFEMIPKVMSNYLFLLSYLAIYPESSVAREESHHQASSGGFSSCIQVCAFA